MRVDVLPSKIVAFATLQRSLHVRRSEWGQQATIQKRPLIRRADYHIAEQIFPHCHVSPAAH
jgi:hypothetical protein